MTGPHLNGIVTNTELAPSLHSEPALNSVKWQALSEAERGGWAGIVSPTNNGRINQKAQPNGPLSAGRRARITPFGYVQMPQVVANSLPLDAVWGRL